MSIAFYDADFIANIENCYFNNSLMKLSTYYKQKKEIVNLITDLSKAHLYSKVIYWQDREDIEFSPLLSQIENVEFYGLAFTNGRRIQLAEEIERCLPDKSLYLRVIDRMTLTKKEEFRIKKNQTMFPITFLQKEDKWELIEHSQRPGGLRTVLISEPKIQNIKDWESFLKSLANDNTSVCFKFPQHCYSREELLVFSKLIVSLTGERIVIDYPLNKKEICFLTSTLSKSFLDKCVIEFGKEGMTLEELKIEIHDLLNYCLYVKSMGKRINLRYLKGYNGLTANYFAKYLTIWNNDIMASRQKSLRAYFQRNKQAVKVFDLVEKSIPQIGRPMITDPFKIYKEGGFYIYDILGNQK